MLWSGDNKWKRGSIIMDQENNSTYIRNNIASYVCVGQLLALTQAERLTDRKTRDCVDMLTEKLDSSDARKHVTGKCGEFYSMAIKEYSDRNLGRTNKGFDGLPDMLAIGSELLFQKFHEMHDGSRGYDLRADMVRHLKKDDVASTIWNAVWAGYFYTYYFLNGIPKIDSNITNLMIGDINPISMLDDSLYNAIVSDMHFSNVTPDGSLDTWQMILEGITYFNRGRMIEEEEQVAMINDLLTSNDDEPVVSEKFVMKEDRSNNLDIQKDDTDCTAVWMFPRGIQVCIPGMVSEDIDINIIRENKQDIVRIFFRHKTVFIRRKELDICVDRAEDYDWEDVSITKGIMTIPKKK